MSVCVSVCVLMGSVENILTKTFERMRLVLRIRDKYIMSLAYNEEPSSSSSSSSSGLQAEAHVYFCGSAEAAYLPYPELTCLCLRFNTYTVRKQESC